MDECNNCGGELYEEEVATNTRYPDVEGQKILVCESCGNEYRIDV